MKTPSFHCPVCGFPGLFGPPRSAEGGSYEICPPCGFQFGVSDDDEGITYHDWCRRWVAAGRPWDSVSIAPPTGWNPLEQLQSLPGG